MSYDKPKPKVYPPRVYDFEATGTCPTCQKVITFPCKKDQKVMEVTHYPDFHAATMDSPI